MLNNGKLFTVRVSVVKVVVVFFQSSTFLSMVSGRAHMVAVLQGQVPNCEPPLFFINLNLYSQFRTCPRYSANGGTQLSRRGDSFKKLGEIRNLDKNARSSGGLLFTLIPSIGVSKVYYGPQQPKFFTFYQRFIGVVYIEEEEHLNHYNTPQINHKFDAILFVDKTNAVRLLD